MKRTYVVASIAATAFFMQQLDTTIVTTALPRIALSFGANAIQLNVVVTAYVFSMAVFLPMSGWLADKFGGRNVFQTSVALFTLGSLWCGVSDNVTELTIARIVQGAGGAFMLPVGRMVVLRTAEKSQFIQALAVLQIPAQIGAASGPLLGGLIATYTSWRWIFLVNIPFGLVGLLLAGLFIENFRESERKPFDLGGFFLIGGFLVSLLYGVETLSRRGISDVTGLSTVLCGLLLLVLTVRHSHRHPYPLADLSLLRLPTFRANLTGGTMFRLGADGLPFLLPLLFQVVFHFSALLSGVLTFASAAGSLAIRAGSAPIFRRFGFRAVLIANALISAALIFSYSLLSQDTALPLIFGLLFLGGTLQALEFVALNAISYADINPARMSAATTFAQLGQRTVGGLGVTLGSLLLQIALAWRGATEPDQTDFVFTFAVISLLAASSVFFFRTLGREAGQEVSGYRDPAGKS